MACQVRTPFLYVVASIAFCLVFYHHYLRDAISSFSSLQLSPSATSTSNYPINDTLTTTSTAVAPVPAPAPAPIPSYAIRENLPAAAAAAASAAPNYATIENLTIVHFVNSPPPLPPTPISTTSILLPGWEVFVIVPWEKISSDSNGDFCVFDNNEVSPAKYFGRLPFPDRATFICPLPLHARRRLPFRQPVLTKSPMHPPETKDFSWPLLLQWSHLVYDSLTTNNDVVLFVKGVNIHQGTNRKPSEFRCVFGDDASNGVRTAVTTSMQEVFRCPRPKQTTVPPVKISLEIVTENKVVPSVAYYTSPRRLESKQGKSLLCANTMVYNVAKFLREWVIYHSKIGVEKFLLYDNGSDDDLQQVVEELVKEGFDISTYFWAWPKTQEAGFSHAAIYAKEVCTWIIYIDVDEFVYTPSWDNLPKPSTSLLQSLLARNSSKLGQMNINCREFGPSEQRVHPVMGVTQGYHCRRRHHNRHKSIVLLDAIDHSLLNVVHHFKLRRGYKTKRFISDHIVVNHYKYQAWPEFRAKFRRRVSAYVLDWTQKLNPKSHDRAPGLGFSAVEPDGWPQKFCEVHDHGLRDLTRKWFGMESGSGYKMAWQR